ncbi:MAG: 4-phosphoerythronate dehydrogenase [Alistipes sp.]|nr:4-phosphoerythronate dehydrogenase [Alistipes sp.]
MKFVIDSAIPYISGVLEPYGEVVYLPGKDFTPADVRDADALIIRTRTRCDASLLEGSRVRLIATATIGFDHIDFEWCNAHNIKVVTAAGCNAAGVLQWVSAALAMLSETGGLLPEKTTLGIVGVGNVGSLVERYTRAWGFRVLRCDPPRQQREGGDFLPLEQVLQQSDIVTLHTPLDATTYHMINHETLSLMRSDAVLINASRGEVAATDALLATDRPLFIDVWENEPNIDEKLLHKAVVATPHIAGYSAQGKANATAMVVAAVAEEFSLPLVGWYPENVSRVERQNIEWQRMCDSIKLRCDLHKITNDLRQNPNDFELLRNEYHYREEYF